MSTDRAEQMMWALTALSIAGVVLNILHRREGFAIWMATNLAWAVIDYRKRLTAQAVLFLVYFALAVWGFVAWA